jgi:hypothetical protein
MLFVNQIGSTIAFGLARDIDPAHGGLFLQAQP